MTRSAAFVLLPTDHEPVVIVPVIAAVNGHSFAGGMVLAMACDYRVMTDGTKRNAWMSMNEVRSLFRHRKAETQHALELHQIHFGAQIPLSLMAVLRAKASNAQVLRKIVLEGHRFTPKEALSAGLADHIAGESTEGLLSAAQQFAEKIAPIAKSGAWGINKVRSVP